MVYYRDLLSHSLFTRVKDLLWDLYRLPYRSIDPFLSGRLIGLYCQVPAVTDKVAYNAVGLRDIVKDVYLFISHLSQS